MRPSLLACSASSEVKHDLAGGGARRGRQADADHLALGVRIDGRMQKLVERGGVDARDGLLLRDQLLRPPCRRRSCSAALAVRLPERVCSIHSLPRSMVNSRSCMSR